MTAASLHSAAMQDLLAEHFRLQLALADDVLTRHTTEMARQEIGAARGDILRAAPRSTLAAYIAGRVQTLIEYMPKGTPGLSAATRDLRDCLELLRSHTGAARASAHDRNASNLHPVMDALYRQAMPWCMSVEDRRDRLREGSASQTLDGMAASAALDELLQRSRRLAIECAKRANDACAQETDRGGAHNDTEGAQDTGHGRALRQRA